MKIDIEQEAEKSGLIARKTIINNAYYGELDGKEVVIVESKRGKSPRGDYYYYAIFYDGVLSAIGEEQGNYAGGLLTLDSLNELPSDLLMFIKKIKQTNRKKQ